MRLTNLRHLAKFRNVMEQQRTAPLDVLRHNGLAVAMVLGVVLLAGVNWIQDPGQAQRWLRTMLILPLLLLGLTLWYAWIRRSPRPAADKLSRLRYFQAALTLSVLAAGIPLITSLGLRIWVRLGTPSAGLELERRILGLASSAVFVVVGNALPKILTPLSILPLPLAERVASARRFVGTVLVILGVAMTIGFIAAPLTYANMLAQSCFIAGVATVLGAIVWMNIGAAGEER
jgi:hypothetical protein